MYIRQRIEIKPNNKQKTYFRKCFKVAVDAWNWGLDEWNRLYGKGEHADGMMLRKKYCSIKEVLFPDAMEVTTHASSFQFRHLQEAFNRYYKRVKQKSGVKGHPHHHQLNPMSGSFTFSFSGRNGRISNINEGLPKHLQMENPKHSYILVGERCGWVKMRERVRFKGACPQVTITQKADKWYATFAIKITQNEFRRTHKRASEKERFVGIDLGIEKYATLSDGVAIENPRYGEKQHDRIRRVSRQCNRKQFPRTKAQKAAGLSPSNNYYKCQRKLTKIKHHISLSRHDFIHKLTSIICRRYRHIAIEHLHTKDMGEHEKGWRRATRRKRVKDAAMTIFQNQIQLKAPCYGAKVTIASRWYASTKLCSHCGQKSNIELRIVDRIFTCEHCGAVIDRDLNAAYNLRNMIGVASPESITPADLGALVSALGKCQIPSFKVGNRKVLRKRKSQLAVHV